VSGTGDQPVETNMTERLLITRTGFCARSMFLIIFLMNVIQENIYLSCVPNNFKSLFV